MKIKEILAVLNEKLDEHLHFIMSTSIACVSREIRYAIPQRLDNPAFWVGLSRKYFGNNARSGNIHKILISVFITYKLQNQNFLVESAKLMKKKLEQAVSSNN